MPLKQILAKKNLSKIQDGMQHGRHDFHDFPVVPYPIILTLFC